MSQWITFFDELDRVFRQCAQLLKDADALLDRRGFTCWHASENQVGMQSSGSIHSPAAWFPRWVVRFYARHDDKDKALGPMAFVSVFLSDEAGRANWKWSPRQEEPLIVAGVIEGTPGVPIGWSYWSCKWWFWLDGAEVGGHVSTFEPEARHKQNWVRMKVFAIPLSAVASIEDLEARVGKPLEDLLQAAGASTEPE